MRILGYLDHNRYKVTVFQHEQRLLLKFEDGLYEQVFKFRQTQGLENLQDLQQLIDPPFVETVQTRFAQMRQSVIDLMNRRFPQPEDEPEIEII